MAKHILQYVCKCVYVCHLIIFICEGIFVHGIYFSSKFQNTYTIQCIINVNTMPAHCPWAHHLLSLSLSLHVIIWMKDWCEILSYKMIGTIFVCVCVVNIILRGSFISHAQKCCNKMEPKRKMMICGVWFHLCPCSHSLSRQSVDCIAYFPICMRSSNVPATIIILSIFQLENLLSDININILMVCKTQNDVDRHSIPLRLCYAVHEWMNKCVYDML